MYLWVYTEIDETLLYTEIQTATVKELENEIYEIKNSIESLNRADAISKRAKRELNMVFTDPETLSIFQSEYPRHIWTRTYKKHSSINI